MSGDIINYEAKHPDLQILDVSLAGAPREIQEIRWVFAVASLLVLHLLFFRNPAFLVCEQKGRNSFLPYTTLGMR